MESLSETDVALYHRPRALGEALRCLSAHDVTIVAGATDVYPGQVSNQMWSGSRSQKSWLDISGIEALQGIAERDDHYRIGALATWADLIDSSLPPGFDGLIAAAKGVGGQQVQNRATLVGNLCNASPAADGMPPLLSLNAVVEIQSADVSRLVPVDQFILGNRSTVLSDKEMVVGIRIPKQFAAGYGAFMKLGARNYLVISIVAVAVLININEEDEIASVSVAVGSCSTVALQIPSLEQRLLGTSIHVNLPELVEPSDFDVLTPIDDVRASAEYRRDAACVVTSRLLGELAHKLSTSRRGAQGMIG